MDITTALEAPLSKWENFPPNRVGKRTSKAGVKQQLLSCQLCAPLAVSAYRSGIRQEVVICYSSHRAAIWIEIEESKESSHPQYCQWGFLCLVTMSIMRIVLLALVCACEAQLFELEDFKAYGFFHWHKRVSQNVDTGDTWEILGWKVGRWN